MITKEKYKEILEKMLLTRRFEEKVSYFFSMGMVHGTTHLYIGEEAVASGVCDRGIVICGTFTPRSVMLESSVPMRSILAERHSL